MTATTKPPMRKLTVAIDEGSTEPKVIHVQAAYYHRERNNTGATYSADLIEFKDDNGKIVLAVSAARVIYIHRDPSEV